MNYFYATSRVFKTAAMGVIFLIIAAGNSAAAQGVGISETSITPNASAILELRSTLRGLLPPRMTTTERNAIASPAVGLVIYNTTTDRLNFYTGAAWIPLITADSLGTASGTSLLLSGLTSNSFLYSGASGALSTTTAPTNGEILIGSTGNAPSSAALTAGSNFINITNGAGSITIGANVANAALSANQTTTSTTLGNVTGLSFSIGAGETWSFEFNIQNGCNNTGGIRYAITFPSGTLRAPAVGMSNAVTAQTSSVITVSGTQTGVAYNTVNNANGWTRITGSIINGVTAGTVQLQFKSNTGGQTSTIFTNSYMTARRH
ncbi:MAG: hypothetical protein WCT99_12940 [Bacteroidota bacterium]|jgi:hypothetical protein